MDDADLRRILGSCPTIAVLGIHHEPSRPAFYVPEYLADVGYEILGVNPVIAGRALFGHPVRASLAEVTAGDGRSIDLVDVFRRAELLPAHVDELIACKPRVVWFQLGIRNDVVARALEAAGIEVVQDRCTLADHQRLRMGPPTRAAQPR